MEEYPEHWRATLMGFDFWKDAANYEDDLNKKFDAALNPNLHTQFPFNLAVEQGPRLTEEVPKKRRRLSLSEIRKPQSLRRHASLNIASSRIRDFRNRPSSPSKKPPALPNFKFPLHSAFRAFSDVKDTTVETVEVTPPLPIHSPAGSDPTMPSKSHVGFHGGESWSGMSRTTAALGLDLFRPAQNDQEEGNILDIMELQPLCQFRGLRSLKITGMMQSYQMYIWQAAWLNANLDKLELGMALEPELLSPIYTAQWKLIQDSWKMGDQLSAEPVYYGYRGNGILHPDIGCGEYLDKHSIEKAKIRALAMGRTPKRLGIKTLVLTGFVVDADPFLHWFDPHKLRSIHFKGHCVDAGFWLARSMRQVTIRRPKAIDLEAVPTGILSLNLWKDLKVVGLKGGKKVEEVTLGEVEKCRS